MPDRMRPGAVVPVLVLVAGLAVAACGGHGNPSRRGDRNGGLRQWAAKADRICGRMEMAIARRGEPRDLGGVLPTARRAALDIQAAIDDIRALPVPRSARRAVGRFEDALTEVDRAVGPFRHAHGAPRTHAVADFAAALRAEGADVEGAAQRAGLRVCAREAEWRAQYDALLAPIFRDAFERLRVAVALAAADARHALAAAPPADRARICDRTFQLYQDAEARLGELRSPTRADDAASDYGWNLSRHGDAWSAAADQAKRGRLDVGRLTRTLARADAAERRLDERVRRATAPRRGAADVTA